jgi:hypothetical protein
MNVNAKLFNTLPSKKDTFWQMVLLPTISVLNSVDPYDEYVAINFEFLFWSLTLLISNNDNDKRTISSF